MSVAVMDPPAWTEDHDKARAACIELGKGLSMLGSVLAPYDGRPEDLVFELSGNGRVARCVVRPGFVRGQYLGLAVKCWGSGHWCIREGQPANMTEAHVARCEALRWIESGR